MNKILYYIGEFFYSLALICTLPSFMLQSLGNWVLSLNNEEEVEDDDGE